jgi:hypothetical protein
MKAAEREEIQQKRYSREIKRKLLREKQGSSSEKLFS